MLDQPGGSRAGMSHMRFLGRIGVCVIAVIGLLGSVPATARLRHGTQAPVAASAPIFEWILLDAETGQVLSEHDADVSTYPASLTKMMTLYLTFEELNKGAIRLDQPLRVSEWAASRAPSKLGLTRGD